MGPQVIAAARLAARARCIRGLVLVIVLGVGAVSAVRAQCSIRFTSPARGAVVTSPTLVVSGTASGFTQRYAAGSATATVNGRTFFSYSGVFTAQMNFGGGASAVATLQPGVNVLSVSGSASGCSASDSMVVHYEPLPGPGQSKIGAPTDPNCSNPINGAGGNKYQHEVDLIATAESPLPFERHYNAVISTSRALSRGWLHTYDRMVIAFEPELGSSAYPAVLMRPKVWFRTNSTINRRALACATFQLVGYRQDNGAVITRRHYEDGLFAGQDVNTAGASAWLNLEHDANGNVTTRAREAGTANFAYDPLDRLSSESGPRTQGFSLDANGNRLSDGSGSLSYQPNSNRLSTAHGQAVILDEAGNTLQARGLNFDWNDAGQLHSASRAGTVLATYAYDHRWLRVRKTTAAGTIHYHHDPSGKLIAETRGAGQAGKSYVWLGDLPLAMIEHGGAGERILYLEADHLNSPIAARDQAG